MERESEEKIGYDHAIEIAASSQNPLADGNRVEWQTSRQELILAQK